ncbi:MAG: GNAT family N-acetyltransferase [Erysipelotrichales bacterium]|nr:GNAT family N-acetyltransferase [Erysipelotrichales bacterium]
MIREFALNALKNLNMIGSLISDNFVSKNKIEHRSKLDYVKIFVYEEDNIIKGFIELEVHFEVVEIINIAVDESYQKQGVASKLLKYVIDNFKCERILLEVKEDNEKALNFYKKHNFIEINRREKYYGDKDAIIMERSIV